MCRIDHTAVAAAVGALAAAYPHLAGEGATHPALAGCEDVAWAAIAGCPGEVPVVLRGLLDAGAAEEAERVLGSLVMAGPMRIGAAMPAVVPFLLRLVADPSVPRRNELFELVLLAAGLCRPTDPDSAWSLAIDGREEDHPERAECRAAFTADADLVSRLLADTALLTAAKLRDYESAHLLEAAGLQA
ncbi:hypothetical protein [Actinosynnema sp. NPDC020468]|uniref:hypothetical protein n=1 Tax=Actinosynnema sp. NPDC020468 TaxID=3154488 RepID=UPI0033CB6BE8